MLCTHQSILFLLMGASLAPSPDGAAGEHKFIAPKPVSVLDGEGDMGGIVINDLWFLDAVS